MTTGLLPVRPPKTESIYAGFWRRLASLVLDMVIIAPVLFFFDVFLNNLNFYVFYFTFIPTLLIRIWFSIYLVKQYGGTPGKLIVGIIIVKTNGNKITWRAAILREIVTIAFLFIGVILNINTHLLADISYFDTLSWIEKQNYLNSLTPAFFEMHNWAFNIWTISELIVLLFNKRKRALHDFIAGTVVIKKKYLDKANDVIEENLV